MHYICTMQVLTHPTASHSRVSSSDCKNYESYRMWQHLDRALSRNGSFKLDNASHKSIAQVQTMSSDSTLTQLSYEFKRVITWSATRQAFQRVDTLGTQEVNSIQIDFLGPRGRTLCFPRASVRGSPRSSENRECEKWKNFSWKWIIILSLLSFENSCGNPVPPLLGASVTPDSWVDTCQDLQ